MKKNNLVTILVVLAVIVLAIIILSKPAPTGTSEEIAKCIGENSELYVQAGCSHCEDQKELFGENYQYLNIIDCFFEIERCEEITATPTWIIDGKKIAGFQSIEKLQELTGC